MLIARALAQGADHLILDEPTNHLDIRYQIEVLELVAGLNVTVLAALHDLSLAALFCDTVYLLADGRIVADGHPRTVITTETVSHAYGADVLIVDHPETGTPHLIPRRPCPAPPATESRVASSTARIHSPGTLRPPLLPSTSRRRARSSRLVGGALVAAAPRWLPAVEQPHRRSGQPPRRPRPPPPSSAYPVTISNCGTSVTYAQAPTRAVSNDINTTEDMLALGLQSHMVGEFGASGSLPSGQPFPAQFAAGFKQVHEISPGYFTLEQLIGLKPDFLFAGWDYGLQTGTNLTPDEPGQVRHQDPRTHRVLRPCPGIQKVCLGR